MHNGLSTEAKGLLTKVRATTPPTIRAMGLVWAYWAFPMERYCGDIVRNIRSRRFPYSRINKYVTSRAQLSHITLLYDLDKKLCLQPPASRSRDFILPLCMFSMPHQMSMNLHCFRSALCSYSSNAIC